MRVLHAAMECAAAEEALVARANVGSYMLAFHFADCALAGRPDVPCEAGVLRKQNRKTLATISERCGGSAPVREPFCSALSTKEANG